MAMKKFRKKFNVVEAVQITDATFDAPHPNPEHLEGVTYDPVARRVLVDLGGGDYQMGDIGDWLTVNASGKASVCTKRAFEEQFDPVPDVAEITHHYVIYATDADGTRYFIELHPGDPPRFTYSHEPPVVFAALARLFGKTPGLDDGIVKKAMAAHQASAFRGEGPRENMFHALQAARNSHL